MLQNILISVIVPVYNVEKYLRRSVNSIRNQTYTNLEIILIDDGSTDQSGVICEQFKELDKRIKVIHQRNGGLSAARNTGIQNATGDYLGFVDSDDYIESDMYELMIEKLLSTKASLVICDCEKIDGIEGNKIEEGLLPLQEEVITGEKCLQRLNAVNNPNYWKYVTAWNKLYHKTVFENLLYPVGKKNEDEYIAHYILERCNVVAILPQKLYKYVQREGSIMNLEKQQVSYDRFYSLIDRYYFFQKRQDKEMMQSVLLVLYLILKEYLEKKGNKAKLIKEYRWLKKQLFPRDKMRYFKIRILWMIAK